MNLLLREGAATTARITSGWTRHVWKNPSLFLGLAGILAIGVPSALAPVLAPYSPTEVHLGQELKPPSWNFPLGTDELGRDILSRVLYGGRISFAVSLTAVGLSASLGTFLGCLLGYFGGPLDLLVMRIVEVFMAFPVLLFAMVFIAVIGSGYTTLILALGLISLPPFVTVARGMTLTVREREYVSASKASGASDWWILSRHILPSLRAVILNQTALSASITILVESALTYLGIGIQPPTPSWGSMLNAAQSYMSLAPWLALAPGLAICCAVFSFNLLADGLRDILEKFQRP